jgi:hypothetical protein
LTEAQQTEKIDTAIVSRLKREETSRSQVMNILSMLTDVNGPRLTNSPGYKKAAAYAKSSLESWGVQNVFFDYWDEIFGRGWELKKFKLEVIKPTYASLVAYPKAWSPGVKGALRAEAIYLDVKKEADLDLFQGKLKGKIVLFTPPVDVEPAFKANAWRLTDSTLLQMANAEVPRPFTFRRNRTPSAAEKLEYLKWDFCQKEGALAVVEGSENYADGAVLVSGATVPYPQEVPYSRRIQVYDEKAPKILPQVVVSAEQYNSLIRQGQLRVPITLELSLETEFTPAERGFNVIGEIPGTDLRDQVVMIGAHLDSWHSGNGTTDNAAGSAVMLETMRLLKSLGMSPRRTIRIALWGGEEQGLLGSGSYVKRTFGVRRDKAFPYDSIELTPAAKSFSVYFNMDNGTGKYRGVYLQGNENAMPVFRAWLRPFVKSGAATLTLRNTTGTDHLSFDAIGLPAFQFIQDPIEYATRTHHTSLDVYDKALESDLKHNAWITAVFTWLAANREELIPRK